MISKGHVIPRTYGRCGNFLFQAACAIAYAQKHDYAYTLPANTTPGRDPKFNPVYLPHLVRKGYDPNLPNPIIIKERAHSYQELPFKEEWRGTNIVLDGYWQSEKYFNHIRQEILDLFDFPWEVRPGVVSVHVRRGDYLRLTKKHPPVPIDWIKAAMEKFPGKQFLFFSDEIDWCWQMFGSRADCQFFQGKDEVADLTEMSCCEDNICSSSTFSWWAMYLNRNPNKRVIFPKLWFTPGYGLDAKDIVPDWCEKL
jgi:Glycosyl transferase family 11